MAQNILIVYPHNLFTDKSGVNSRYLELLAYFKDRKFRVDLFALENFKSSWAADALDARGLVDHLYLYDFKKGGRWQRPGNRKNNPLNRLKRYLPLGHVYNRLEDYAYGSMQKQFDALITAQRYHFILIGYVHWANLIRSRAVGPAVTVLDLTDFITLNKFDLAGQAVDIFAMMKEEIRRVNLFDRVLCISDQEKYFFSQFAGHPQYHYIPFFMDDNSQARPRRQQYDLLFIGSDNAHNQKGVQWFFEQVYPRLDRSVRVLIAGAIAGYVRDYDNVTRIAHVENLAEVYRQSRISICPLLGGTGMKIKVIEALSHGLPIVSTEKGLGGFPAKIHTGAVVCDSPEKFAAGIQRFLADADFYQRHRQYARKFFKENFSRSVVYRQLDQAFR